MLQVGAKARDAAFSLASGASSLSPISRISSGSKVAPMAVEHYVDINSASALGVMKEELRAFDVWFIAERTSSTENATKGVTSSQQGSARLTSRTLAGVLIKKWLPRMPLGPSLTLIAGIPSLSIAQVCQKPTPEIREMASSMVSPSRTVERSAFAKSEGGICTVLDQGLENTRAKSRPTIYPSLCLPKLWPEVLARVV